MKNLPKYIQILIAVGMVLAAGLVTFFLLPEAVPISFADDGAVTGTMPRIFAPLISCGTAALILLSSFLKESKHTIASAVLFGVLLDVMFLVVSHI